MLFARRSTVCHAVIFTSCFLILTARPALSWDSLIGHESCEFVVSQMAPEEESATLIIAAFITGVNYATGRTLDADVEEMVSWVRDYCEQNSSARFLDALIGLDEELDARQVPAEEPMTETGERSAPPTEVNK